MIWSKIDNNALIENYLSKDVNEIIPLLSVKRSKNAVYNHAKHLVLTSPKKHHLKNGFQKGESWEDRFGLDQAEKMRKKYSELGKSKLYAYSEEEEKIIEVYKNE